MQRRELVWFREEDDSEPFLTYRDEDPGGEPAPNATLEQLADLCDMGAESVNAHDFVGAHRLLAALLYRHVGRPKATEILREVAEFGGLDHMNGVCEADDAYENMGVPQPWKDWRLGE